MDMAQYFLAVPTFFLGGWFASAGLTRQTIFIDATTRIRLWGPPRSQRNNKKPSLLLIHGLGPPAVLQWFRQARPLSQSYNLYVPDLVYFGQSTSAIIARGMKYNDRYQATCMVKMMEKFKVPKYYVCGTSFGGFVAYNLAKMYPDKVKKLVIASSNPMVKQLVTPTKMDVMLIWGNFDWIFPVVMSYSLKRLLGRKASLKIIWGTGHVPQVERAWQFNRIVKSFLR